MLRPHPLAGARACGVRAGRCGLVWLFQKSRLRHGLRRPGRSTSASASASSRRPGLRCLSLCPKQEANSAQCGDRKDQSGLSSQQRDSLFLFLPFALFRSNRSDMQPHWRGPCPSLRLPTKCHAQTPGTRIKQTSRLPVIQPSRRIQLPITVRRLLW